MPLALRRDWRSSRSFSRRLTRSGRYTSCRVAGVLAVAPVGAADPGEVSESRRRLRRPCGASSSADCPLDLDVAAAQARAGRSAAAEVRRAAGELHHSSKSAPLEVMPRVGRRCTRRAAAARAGRPARGSVRGQQRVARGPPVSSTSAYSSATRQPSSTAAASGPSGTLGRTSPGQSGALRAPIRRDCGDDAVEQPGERRRRPRGAAR